MNDAKTTGSANYPKKPVSRGIYASLSAAINRDAPLAGVAQEELALARGTSYSSVRSQPMKSNLGERTGQLLTELRHRRALVHNITNYVVMDFSANALLAIGASPVMAHAVEEVREMVALAGALVINIGTLSTPWIEAMLAAGHEARERGIPIVLDPVGAGATRLRTETAMKLITEVNPTVVRGNASEILSLGQAGGQTRGVDSTRAVDEAQATAMQLASAWHTCVAVTGAEDFITDGRRRFFVANGHPLMGRVTGTGCVASALTGAFLAVEKDAAMAATCTLVAFGVAGELAATSAPHPGTFRTRLIDALDAITAEAVVAQARANEA
jgi:hydroxyethylthiazole kinase